MNDPSAISSLFDSRLVLGVVALAVAGTLAVLGNHMRRRRRSADRLAENLTYYRTLFDTNPNPIYVYDIETLGLLAVNDTLLKRYGYATDELIGQPVAMLHKETDREAVRQTIARLVEADEHQFRRRWFHMDRKGEVFPVEIFSQPTVYAGRSARLVVVRDIADQVRTEDEVLSQRYFRESLLEALPVPVFYKDASGRYLGMNSAFLRMFGRPLAHFVGKTAWEIAPPELAEKYQAADDELYASPDRTQTYSAQISSATLGVRDVVFTKAVFRNTHGEVAGLIGTVLDVTEQLASERALRESKGELAQILENSPLPIFAIDAEHTVVVWNPACERTFGPSAGEMIGRRELWRAFYATPRPVMADIVLDGGDETDVARYYPERYRRSAFNPEAFEAEDYFPHLGENGRWLYFTASPLRDADGRRIGAIETLVDITERKQAEQEARELNERLELRVEQRTADLHKANEDLQLAMKQLVQTEKLASLGSLVAGVAHELNTPLGNVLTVASALHDRTVEFAALIESGAALRRSSISGFIAAGLEATSLIERNAERAAGLIGNFKAVAVDQTSARRRQFDLAEVIGEMLSTLRPALRRAAHEIAVDVPAGILIDSYPGPLEQVLGNLIMNSLLHGFEDRPNGRIHLRAWPDDRIVRLRYTDDGAGMSETVARQAFDPFFTTKLGRGGSGLGLYVSFNLVTAVLGGSITLDSAPGKGVCFEIALPTVAPYLTEPDVSL